MVAIFFQTITSVYGDNGTKYLKLPRPKEKISKP